MVRNATSRLIIFGALLLISASNALAGANSWTGSRPAESFVGAPSRVSSDPGDPDLVYATFGRDFGDHYDEILYRSEDGGRTWTPVKAFQLVYTLLVHPGAPSSIYVSGYLDGLGGIFVSHDSGASWTQTLDRTMAVLAASPNDPSVVYAGGLDVVFKSDDDGVSWHGVDFSGVVASLVIHPRDDSTLYASSEGFEYFGEYPGFLGKSTDGGRSWADSAPGPADSFTALAVDPIATSTVYVAVGPYSYGAGLGTQPDVLRSEDGGASWTRAGDGLPGTVIASLVADPRVSGTLYAGTGAGVYRTRDGGRSWTPFGQILAGKSVTSLVISDDGRRLLAGTYDGTHSIEISRGPLDLGANPGGGTRVLAFDGDRLTLGALDASGSWTVVSSGQSSSTWTPVALAGSGERTSVLWQNGDGRSSLEILGPAGRQSAVVFPARPGWIPSDVSARPDGDTNVLWTDIDGGMQIERANGSGVVGAGPVYGPYAGWSAIALAEDSSGQTWVLWRSADGRVSLSVHRDGVMISTRRLGAYLDWSPEDLTIGADGRPRLLRTSRSGLASVVTIDERGLPVSGGRYTLPGFTPRHIAAGPDGLTRLLFGSDDGQGEILLLDGDNRLVSRQAVHPLASVVVTNSAELAAAMTPANAGKQILVKAGDYQVANPLTVPDRATVIGEGVMSFDADGLPAGIAAAGRTVLRSTAELTGDVVTLGNGSSLRGLVIEDAEGRTTGNPVAVVSRAAGDFVAARIEACEIVNPNPSGVSPPGPTGRALVVVTRNPNLSQDPPQHEGAVLDVRMSQSILRSPAGAIGLFAINFASHAKIDLDLRGNVIGGGLTASGGVSRPDAVTGSTIAVRSRGNLYRSDSADPTPQGWNLSGGSTAVIPNIVSEASTLNSLRVQSTDDRIEGFLFAISGVGGQRVIATSEEISFNTLDLNVQGARLQSAVADLSLLGAVSFAPGVVPGDGNVLRLNMRHATGSGPRDNSYANSSEGLGEGNRLQVAGSPNAFDHTNQGIDPRPADEFFQSQ